MPSYVRNTNIPSLISQHQLSIGRSQVAQSMERLSSGFRINHAADDAAGLAISHNLTSQILKMNQANENAQDGVSVLQIADGSLGVINDSLQRVRELTVQAGNDSYSTAMRSAIKGEISSLVEDINRIAASSKFNGMNVLDGTMTNALIQVGPDSAAASNSVNISSALTSATDLGIGLFGTVPANTFSTLANFQAGVLDTTTVPTFLNDIDKAIQNVNLQRSKIGSYQNQLDNMSQNLQISVENISNANSRIRDTDVASETAKLAQSQVLQDAAVSILGQTNRLPQMILGLLQNR